MPWHGPCVMPCVLDSMIERDKFFAVLAGAAGGALAIGAMEFFAIRTAYPLVAIPFATSIVWCWARPRSNRRSPARSSAAI
jgi:hypothetical protein